MRVRIIVIMARRVVGLPCIIAPATDSPLNHQGGLRRLAEMALYTFSFERVHSLPVIRNAGLSKPDGVARCSSVSLQALPTTWLMSKETGQLQVKQTRSDDCAPSCVKGRLIIASWAE